jgi:hypothetical protein
MEFLARLVNEIVECIKFFFRPLARALVWLGEFLQLLFELCSGAVLWCLWKIDGLGCLIESLCERIGPFKRLLAREVDLESSSRVAAIIFFVFLFALAATMEVLIWAGVLPFGLKGLGFASIVGYPLGGFEVVNWTIEWTADMNSGNLFGIAIIAAAIYMLSRIYRSRK